MTNKSFEYDFSVAYLQELELEQSDFQPYILLLCQAGRHL